MMALWMEGSGRTLRATSLGTVGGLAGGGGRAMLALEPEEGRGAVICEGAVLVSLLPL